MDVNGKGPTRKGLKGQIKGQRFMTKHPIEELRTDTEREECARAELQGLMFRTRNTQIIKAITSLIDHFNGIERWTETADAPVHYLNNTLAPIERRRAITYEDVAQAISDMPTLYYRFVNSSREVWSPFAMPFAEFERLYADKPALPGLHSSLYSFISPQPICDGRELVAHLLQQSR